MFAFTEFSRCRRVEVLRPYALRRPDPVMGLQDSVAQPSTRLLGTWPVKFQRPVEQDDVNREPPQFTVLPVIRAVRGCDEQTEHQR